MKENGSENKLLASVRKHWAAAIAIIVIAFLYLLAVVDWCMYPESRFWLLHIIVLLVLVSVLLIWMKGKHFFVREEVVKEEECLTPHGFFFSRILVPVIYTVAGIAVFGFGFYQLKAQNDATEALLIEQQKEMQAQTRKLLSKQQSDIQTQLDTQNKLLERIKEQNEISKNQLAEQIRIAQSQLAAQQFNNAIINLGSESQAVVHGGVHALNHLAMKNDEYRKQVFDILCSFLREETQRPEYKTRILEKVEGTPEYLAKMARSDNTKPEPSKNGTSLSVIQTIVDILFVGDSRNYYQGKDYKINLYGAFLQDIKFEKAIVEWAEADLRYVDLQEVDLSNADMQEALLWGANLQGTLLLGTNLQEAELQEANLQAALLAYVNLQEADLTKANLQGTRLREMKLLGADLTRANLQGAQFIDTKLQGTKLDHADFRGVQSGFGLHEAFKKAVNTGSGLKTDLSGITLFDDDGNKLDLTEEGKKEWFRNHGAKVDDLSPKEVQDLYNSLKEYILRQQPDFEENEEIQPEDAPVEGQGTDDL